MAKDLRVEVAKINTSVSWMKGIGGVVAGSALAIAILVGTGIHRFGYVEGEIAGLRRDMELVRKDTAEFRAEVGLVRKDTAELRVDFEARDDRLDRTLARIKKALPPTTKAN